MSKTKEALMARGEHNNPYTTDVTSIIDNLMSLRGGPIVLRVYSFTGVNHLEIEFRCEFEFAHHEDWDLVWIVSLPSVVPYYKWQGHEWRMHTMANVVKKFKSTDLSHALKQAIQYYLPRR